MNFTAPFKPTFDTQEPPKFKKNTLTTLQLVKTYNPKFVTTFIVSQSEAHYLTGDDLRRYENMITLKKRKEINAKYTGLLKSKIKGTSQTMCKNKSNTRADNSKVLRFGSTKIESTKTIDVESDNNFKSQLETSKTDYKMKEIFKSNVYSNYSTTSSVYDSVKCPTGKIFYVLSNFSFTHPKKCEVNK